MNMTIKSQSEGIGAHERVLDAYNYLPTIDGVDDALRTEMKGWVEYDHQASLMGKPKNSTNL